MGQHITSSRNSFIFLRAIGPSPKLRHVAYYAFRIILVINHLGTRNKHPPYDTFPTGRHATQKHTSVVRISSSSLARRKRCCASGDNMASI